MPLPIQKMPLISVVIPHFNRERIILPALNSLRNQTFQDFECIVVDDGSTDISKNVLRKTISELGSGKFYFIERDAARKKGANACRNIGIEQSKGSFIAFLDSDDRWTPTYLEDSLNFANSIKPFFASYSGSIISRDRKELVKNSREIRTNEGLFDFVATPDVSAQTSSYFIRQDIAKEIMFDENLLRHQDYDFFIRLGKIYRWSYNPTSRTLIDWTTINTRKTDFDSCITVYKRHKDEFKNKEVQSGYLVSVLGLALRENAKKEFIRFYQRELKQIGFKKKVGLLLLVNFPYLHKYYSRIQKYLLNRFKT